MNDRPEMTDMFLMGKFRKEFRRAFVSCSQREPGDRYYYQYGRTTYNKESGFASGSHSRNDYESHKLNTYKNIDSKLSRKEKLEKKMSGNKCAYYNCGLSARNNPSLRLFHFPVKDTARCKRWILHSVCIPEKNTRGLNKKQKTLSRTDSPAKFPSETGLDESLIVPTDN
ncbi:hypothetical protein JTB14_037232 [Gonioctena quinquepunctata]|nr:hypothetical protein JTB14_037232 [Gonioctena quinquepunctata]